MILLSALLLLAAAQEAQTDEITVLGRRLDSTAVVVARDDKGRLTCDLSQSTGNDHLDRQLCKTAAKCVGKGAIVAESVAACVNARKPGLLDEIRALKGGRA